MNPVHASSTPNRPGQDIVFNCQHCNSPLIVDAAAAGMTLTCSRCNQLTVVPRMAAPVQAATDLERKLKENESQRTEVTSYINQLCIQLHRWKLRLQTLDERKAELEAELATCKNAKQ